MKKLISRIVLVISLLILPIAAQAYTLDCDLMYAGDGINNISFTGGTTPLIGTNIPIGNLLIDGSLLAGFTNGLLNFKTGDATGASWTWGSAGSSILITGLLNGSPVQFLAGQLVGGELTPLYKGVKLGVFGLNEGNAEVGNLVFTFRDYVSPGAPFNTGITGGEVHSTATPIPGALLLLGSGLIGLVGVRRRLS